MSSLLRLIVIDRLEQMVVINPKILESSKEEKSDWEGCLSLPGEGKVSRSTSILVAYHDKHGHDVVDRYSGFLARVFQHEIDHLNGILLFDLIKDQKDYRYVEKKAI